MNQMIYIMVHCFEIGCAEFQVIRATKGEGKQQIRMGVWSWACHLKLWAWHAKLLNQLSTMGVPLEAMGVARQANIPAKKVEEFYMGVPLGAMGVARQVCEAKISKRACHLVFWVWHARLKFQRRDFEPHYGRGTPSIGRGTPGHMPAWPPLIQMKISWATQH